MAGQGSKVCPFSDKDKLSTPHTFASRELLRDRLRMDRDERLEGASPTRDIFQRTAAYITVLRNLGCGAPAHEITNLLPMEQLWRNNLEESRTVHRRGYTPQRTTCAGRLEFGWDYDQPFVRCEHYSKFNNRDHLFDATIGDGSFDLNYLEAVLTEDLDEIAAIEDAAFLLGFGPLVECTTVSNVSSQKIYCPFDHRTELGTLNQTEMFRLSCSSSFQVYEPLPKYREACPYVLVIAKGSHTHPIPLPSKTPPILRSEIFRLLESLEEDLPDITPRRFLRHPIVKNYLTKKFPKVTSPTLSDLHPSLANRSHLGAYITQVKTLKCPHGTGWDGVVYLKKTQDEHHPPEDHYIRRIITINHENVEEHEEDDTDDKCRGEVLRIIICMSKHGSNCLQQAQYVQSDIGFKRVSGFYELELGGMDRDANTSLVFCRVYLNRQSAVAHHRVFQEIEDIVKTDTGHPLRWRHIHGRSPDEYDGLLLSWAGDQHGGQAKGLGLHLQAVSQQSPDKFDLHEPHRLLSSLSPYDHLHRLFRLCCVHVYRNIRTCSVSEAVRNLMRSLVCMTHPDWGGTIQAIIREGGKAGKDWVGDKERSRFAFPGICWEKSFIPKDIWKAGDSNSNLIETAHADANREGIQCTLVGGLKKGQFFDVNKERTLKIFEEAGIRPSYKRGHPSENMGKNVKRKMDAHHNGLAKQDEKIAAHNEKLRTANTRFLATQAAAIQLAVNHGGRELSAASGLGKALQAEAKAKRAYQRQVDIGESLVQTGSGKVGLLLASSPQRTE